MRSQVGGRGGRVGGCHLIHSDGDGQEPNILTQSNTPNINDDVSAVAAVFDATAFSNVVREQLVAVVQSSQASEDDNSEVIVPATATHVGHGSDTVDVLDDSVDKALTQLMRPAMSIRRLQCTSSYARMLSRSTDRTELSTFVGPLEKQISGRSRRFQEPCSRSSKRAKATVHRWRWATSCPRKH